MINIQRVMIYGTGLIGTSIALALRDHGCEVWLTDRDRGAARSAADLGAGIDMAEAGFDPETDIAVIAVPPTAVPATLLEVQKRRVAKVVTDVASVKQRPLAEAAALGADLTGFVAGHPLGGSEKSGPRAARPDLFQGRPWALCPLPETDPAAIEAVENVVNACGAHPVTVDAAEHDRAVALISHAPHVVSAAMAARLGDASDAALRLAGKGILDATRIAAGDPHLWLEILALNADAVADILEHVATDLAAAAAGLRIGEHPASLAGDAATVLVSDLLERGHTGRQRLSTRQSRPGRHRANHSAGSVGRVEQ